MECLVEVARLTIEEGDPQAALPAANDAVKIGEPMRTDSRFGSRERLVLQRAYLAQAQAAHRKRQIRRCACRLGCCLAIGGRERIRRQAFSTSTGLRHWPARRNSRTLSSKRRRYRKEFGRNGYGLYELARIGALAAHGRWKSDSTKRRSQGNSPALRFKISSTREN